MRINYDFCEFDENEKSTIDVLAGNYNENPFLFENKLIHTMGTETYHGYKTIHWTETYRDSEGKLRTSHRSETLHATVTKPKPFYSTQVVLNYCSQGGPDLAFSRDASHLEQRVVVLQNCARLLDKAIDLDKSTFENIAKYRAGAGDADVARNEIGSQIENISRNINVAVENYPDLRAHREIADAM